jgi:hypothetical protein
MMHVYVCARYSGGLTANGFETSNAYVHEAFNHVSSSQHHQIFCHEAVRKPPAPPPPPPIVVFIESPLSQPRHLNRDVLAQGSQSGRHILWPPRLASQRCNWFDLSNLRRLSLRDVAIPPEVMHLMCSALQSANLQSLDLTNCGLTDGAAEALLPLVKTSSDLTDLQLSHNRHLCDKEPIDHIVAVNVFVKNDLQGLLQCPPELHLDDLSPLNHASRIKFLAEVILSKKFECSGLRRLSMRNVLIPPEVMHLMCSALQSANLQSLDLTNCGLTDGAAEALLHLVKSSCLTDLQLGDNNCSSAGLLRIIQECSPRLVILNLENSKSLTQLPSSLTAFTELTSLHIDGCTEMYSLPQWLTGLTAIVKLSLINCAVHYPPPSHQASAEQVRSFFA